MKRQLIDLSGFDEPRLTAICKRALLPDFHLEHEVTGKNLVDGSEVRIDFIAKPKQHLIDNGFVDSTMGIEIKSYASQTVRPGAFAWQAITYAQSEFNGKRPAFVLLFPALEFMRHQIFTPGFANLLLYANVGQLKLGKYRDNWDTWNIFFGTSYYHKKYGLRGNPNEALKRRTGNCG